MINKSVSSEYCLNDQLFGKQIQTGSLCLNREYIEDKTNDKASNMSGEVLTKTPLKEEKTVLMTLIFILLKFDYVIFKFST